MVNTANGSFTAVVSPNSVEITGTGNELVSGSDSVQVKFIITSDSLSTIIIH